MLLFGETVEEANSWTDAINAQAKALAKPQQARPAEAAPAPEPVAFSAPPPPVVQPQTTYLPWEQVKQRIDAENGNWDINKIKDFLVTLGKPTCDQYLYTIMHLVLENWKDEEIASFLWQDFCDGALEDLESVFAGQQGDPTVAVDAEGNHLQENDTVFVLGRDEKGAQRLANVYHWVMTKEEFNWSEVTRCVLSAIANWRLKTDEVFFRVFVVQIIKDWSASEIAAFVNYVASYAKKNELESWEGLPQHVRDFFALSGCSPTDV